MKKKYTPYKFDEDIEYGIYDRIGKKYYKEFMHKKKRDSKELLDFDKYLEWKEYFYKKYSYGFNDDCNFIHYLIERCRMYQQEAEIHKSLMVPLSIAIVTVMISIYLTQEYPIWALLVILTVIMMIIEIICVNGILKSQKKVYFYKDCIEVINNILTSHQN